MNVQVLSFKPAKGNRTRGYVILNCNGLTLNLRIRRYNNEKLYVEMPKIPFGNEFMQPVRIADKEESRTFQLQVLEQIESRWPGALDVKNVVDNNK